MSNSNCDISLESFFKIHPIVTMTVTLTISISIIVFRYPSPNIMEEGYREYMTGCVVRSMMGFNFCTEMRKE